MRAKICGITNLEDALLAVQQGAWAIGFIFYPKSPRYISKSEAKNIIRKLPCTILRVGVFIDEPFAAIKLTCEQIGLDLVQIHNIIEIPNNFKKKVIYSVRARFEHELPAAEILSSYGYIHLDAPADEKGLLGGTGRLCNWKLAQQLAKKYRLIVAGGLHANNVQKAIKLIRPYAVDVASGIEMTPGTKDPNLMRRFLKNSNDETKLSGDFRLTLGDRRD